MTKLVTAADGTKHLEVINHSVLNRIEQDKQK